MDTFNPNQMPPMQPSNEQKSVGPLIAVIVILALIIIGGLYFLKTRSAEKVYPIQQPATQSQTQVETDNVTSSLKQQNKTDDLKSIEADLNATDLNNLDQGASVIEADLR